MKSNFSPGTPCGPLAFKTAPTPQSRLAVEAKIAVSAPLGTQKRYVGERFGAAKPALQRGAVFCAALLMFGALQGAAHADGFTWTGGTSNDWNTGANWTKTGASARVFPNDVTDTATFPTPITANKKPNISASVTVNTLTFNADGYEVASTAGQTLTLGGTTPTVTVGVDQTTTVSNIASTVNCPIIGAGFTKRFGGTLILSATNAFTAGSTIAFTGGDSVRSGALRLTSNGALNGITTINSAQANSSTGRIELQGGVTLGSGVTFNTGGRGSQQSSGAAFVSNSGNNTWAGNINISAGGGGYGIRSLADTLTLSGNLTNTQGSVRTFEIGDSGNILVTGSVRNGTGASTVGFTKFGTGKVTLAGANTYSGLTTITAGTLEVGNGGGTGVLPAGAVTNNGTLTFNRSDNLTISNGITGTGNVVQNGTGTLTFPGINTYAGSTTVNAGALVVNAAAVANTQSGYVPAVRVPGTTVVGSTLLKVGSTAGLTVGLTINGGGVAGGATITAIDANGTDLTMSAAATSSGTANGFAFNTSGNFNGTNNITNLTNTGGLVVGQSVSGTGIAANSVISSINSATAITLSLPLNAPSPGTQSLTFGAGSGVPANTDLIVNGATFRLLPGSVGNAQQPLNLANLTLTDGSTIGAGLGNTPATSAIITVTNAAKVNGNITLAPGVISGASPAAGNYDQVTDANGGLLNTNTSNATYTAAPIPGATFTVNATDTRVSLAASFAQPATTLYWKGGQVAGAPNSWSASNGAITNWTTDAAGNNISPVVPSSVTDVFFSATGATNQDNMVLGSDFSIKSLNLNDATANNTDPFGLQAGNTLSIASTGTVINSGAGVVTVNAVLAGAGGISKNSAADMILGAANTYTGPVTVGAGVLNIRNATGLGTTAAGTTVSNGGTLQVQGGLAVAEPLNLNGVGATGQNGALVSLSGTNSSSAGITLGSNATVSNDSGGTFTLSGAISGPTFTVTLNNAGVGSGLVSGIIGTTTGGVTKTGAGSWQFTNTNTYTGPTTVQAGLLDLKRTTQTAIASGSAVTVADGATIQITDHAGGGQSDYANPLTLNGIGNGTNGALNFVNSGAFAMTGPITLASDSVVRTDVAGQTASSLITFSNAVSGAGGLTLLAGGTTANGTPQFAFTGANTYNGSTLITSNGSGTAPFQVIVSGASDRLPTTTNVRLGGTPTGLTGAFNSNVALSLNGVNQTVAGLQVTTGATGTYQVVGGNATLSTLTVNNSAADTFSGNLGGAGTNNNNLALSKTGSGRLTLTGTDTYTGGTSATGGSLSGSGALGGVTNFATGATHAPGVAGPGIQAVNGNYTLASGSNLVSDIGGTTVGTGYDQVNVTGTVTLGGRLQVALPAAYTPTVGNAFTIVSNDGTDAVASTFSGLPQGALVNSADGRATFTISYTGGDGNDVTLTNSSVRGAGSSAVLISQFRLSGPSGATDEFIELYNNTNAPLNVDGWQLKAGAATQTLAAQTASATQTGSTLIPARGHVLITGGAYSLGGYSLSDLPSTLGDIDPATTLTLVNAGGTTVDTVNNGGALTPDATRIGEQYALVRRFETGLPTGGDSNFNLVSLGQTATNSDGTGTAPFVNTGRLGAPGPRNSQSPVQNNNQAPLTNPAGIANQTAKYISSSGNYNGAAAALSPGGQISIRRTVTNNTAATATRLRFRLAALTAGTSPTAGVADLRAISSKSALLNITGVTVNGLTLEAPSSQTGTGGGLNSSWVTVDLSTTALTLTDNTTATGGLPAGKAANFEFLFGITAPGNYKAVVDVELLP